MAMVSGESRTTTGGPAPGPTRRSRTGGSARTLTGATAGHRPSPFGAMAASAVMTVLQTRWFDSLRSGERRRYSGAGAGSCVMAQSSIGVHMPPILGDRAAGATTKMFANYVLWSKYVGKMFGNYPRPIGRGILPALSPPGLTRWPIEPSHPPRGRSVDRRDSTCGRPDDDRVGWKRSPPLPLRLNAVPTPRPCGGRPSRSHRPGSGRCGRA